MKTDFSSSAVTVIGDIMLDRYYTGSVRRISPEAPVPVINVKTDSSIPGGAANVAHNLAALNSRVHLIGTTGKDTHRNTLISLLDDLKISHSLIASDHPTTTKIRIIGNHQQIARLDFEEVVPLSRHECSHISEEFTRALQSSNTFIISDYAKGVCTPELCRTIISNAKALGKTVIVDPKGRDWEKYSGATIITPNINELADASGIACGNDTDLIISCAQELRTRFSFGSILVTRSEKGMTLISDTGISHFKTEAREVYDVSGAGDTVVAVLAAALSSGSDLHQAVRLSNIAAGIAVGKFGTAPVLADELFFAARGTTSKNIFTLEEFKPLLETMNAQKTSIVFTNGCFDILHRGHVEYLKEAKSLGDILIVGLNTDDSVKRLKGPNRPINKEEDRAAVLASLASVDYVIYFDDDTPHNLIKTIQPEFLVKGGDYNPDTVVGKEFAKNTVIIDFVNGFSTTSTIEKMKTT